jgi:soluble lytic murein transglycosylase-like protein
MQQFRPLPKFTEIEETESVVTQPLDKSFQAITDDTVSPHTTGRVPTVSPHTTGRVPAVSPHTDGRVPVLLLSGPHPAHATEQLAKVAKKLQTTPTSASVRQMTLKTGHPTKRLVVIPAEKKRKKAAAPSKHLQPRTRHTIVLLATLSILIGTLVTLLPLSSGVGGSSLLSNFGNWIRSAQVDSQIQAHINAFNPNPDNLPPMSIPNSPYVSIARQDALDAGISPVYFVRQINQESGFDPSSRSYTNAEGIAQFEPDTAAGLGINPWDPIQALRGAAQLMARYSQKYGGYAKALGAYNGGSGTLLNAENNCGVNWLSCMPGQTQNYVYVIMGI